MPLETGVNYIGDLVSTNPTGTDPKGQGDDHIRNTKRAAQQSFPGFEKAIIVTGEDVGVLNAYELSPTPALVSLDEGTLVVFSPTNANTGASTLEISGLPVKDLLSVSGDALAASEISVGQPVVARYDGTAFRLVTITKQYADTLAFASSLPAISALTIYQGVFNDGAAGLWKRALPQSTAGNLGKVLKSTGTDGYPETSSTYDWDAYQGVSSKSAGFTVALADRGVTFLCTNTITAALTAAATLGSKFYARIINVGTGLVTIDPNSSETITVAGGSAKSSIVLIPGEGVDVFCDGSNWVAILIQDAGAGPHIYAYETLPPNYTGATWTSRNISALETNLVGAAYSAGAITGVPAGRWKAEFHIDGYGTGSLAGRVYNNTTAAEIFHGEIGDGTAFNPSTVIYGAAQGRRQIDLSAVSSLSLQSYGANSSAAGASWGAVTGSSPVDKRAALWLSRISP